MFLRIAVGSLPTIAQGWREKGENFSGKIFCKFPQANSPAFFQQFPSNFHGHISHANNSPANCVANFPAHPRKKKKTANSLSKFLGNPCKFPGKFTSKFRADGKFLRFFSANVTRQMSLQIASQISWQKQIPQQIPWENFLRNFRSKLPRKFPCNFFSQICEQITAKSPLANSNFPQQFAQQNVANSITNFRQFP